MMFLFLVFFLWCSCSCFLTYQSRSSCDPPPTSCSFNYEHGGCKCVKICWFVQCLAIVTCLVAHCAFVVNMRFTPWYPSRCAHHPIWNFVEATSYIFYCYYNPSCIKLGLYMPIGYQLCNNHHLYCFSCSIFLTLLSHLICNHLKPHPLHLHPLHFLMLLLMLLCKWLKVLFNFPLF